MSRISIVGVDGSGKTVLMAVFGEKYERPDGYGYFLSANTPKTFHTVKMMMDRMRHGEWPVATERDTVTALDWSLMQRKGDGNESMGSVSFLDFAGEIYRLAFGEHSDEERKPFKAQIEALQKHISSSDALLVLINLKDIVSGDLAHAKTREMLWISRNIFDYALSKRPDMKVALAFSQFDIYRAEVERLGGLQAAYKKYLSHIEVLYPEMMLLSVSAVNQTTVNNDGFEVPAEHFGSEGLDELLEWIISTVPGHESERAWRRNRPTMLWEKVETGWNALESGEMTRNAERLQALESLVGYADELWALPEETRAGVVSKERLLAVSQSLTEALDRHRAFEDVLRVAQQSGETAAGEALDEVAAEKGCTLTERARIQEEITIIVETAKAAAARAKARKRTFVIGGLLLMSAAAVIGGLNVKWHIEEERERIRLLREAEEKRRQIAEREELARKERVGYVIESQDGKPQARWEEGRVPPANTNLLTASSREEYRAVRPGYVWVPGTMTDAWTPGLAYPDRTNVVAGAVEGVWVATRPGYIVDDQFTCRWKPGVTHPANEWLVSSFLEGEWGSTRIGWKWDGQTGVVWQVGLAHPKEARLVASPTAGEWRATVPGYVWDGEEGVVWKAGLTHPENKNLRSLPTEGKWVSKRGDGWVWDGGAREKWLAGVRLLDHPHWVTVEKEGYARPEPGYRKKDPNASGWCELVWNPGEIDTSQGRARKASSVEGHWLKQVDCSICDGTGTKSGYTDCPRCDGRGRVSGRVQCSSCRGNGQVNTSVSCSQCSGNGWAMFRCENFAHNMRCVACSGRGMVNYGLGWMRCAGCGGSGRMMCGQCNNTGSSLQRCNRCTGTGRVQGQDTCSSCSGSGRVDGQVECSRCDGRRRVSSRVSCTYCGRDGCEDGKVWERE